jgi:superfamily II DNA or RNA helicase
MDLLDLPEYNSTSYPLSLKEQLSKLPYSDDDKQILMYHQYICKEFATRQKHQRGILVCHGMGLGKTKLAVSIAQYYRKQEPKRKVIVLLSKSLEGNFRNTITSYTKQTDGYVDANYKFVSLNASNMFKQVSRVGQTDEQSEYEKRLGDFMADVKKTNSLNNSLLIIDEAHNLFNAITNGAKNATELYDLIIHAYNLKIVFLTGTPIINDPFELVPCFNMLRGPIYTDIGSNFKSKFKKTNKPNGRASKKVDDKASDKHSEKADDKHSDKADSDKHSDKADSDSETSDKSAVKTGSGNTTLLFSEDYEEFENFFIDVKNKQIKNKNKFTSRIFGLSSYYGDIYFSHNVEKEHFPKKLPVIVEHVPMSDFQFAKYSVARSQELEEGKKIFSSSKARFSANKGGSSTYRVKSRQISNYCIPDYALGPVRGAKAREKFLSRIKTEDLLNTSEFSPKLGKVLENIKHFDTSPGMVYSQFVSGEGLGIFALILEANGYEEYDASSTAENAYDIKEKPKKYYAVLSGNIDPDERTKLIEAFNDVDNSNGSIIKLLLMSGAVAEGIDLKRIRHVHILEPFWNYARINQVETRAIRYKSHIDLPEDQQNVQVYIYLSDYPKKYPKNKIHEPTTDVELYTNSIANMKLINSFMLAIAESSIDCSVHYKNLTPDVKERVNCMVCAPTNKQLFNPLLNKDMLLPSNCTPYSEKKVLVNEIIYQPTGDVFYYKIDPNNQLLVKIYNFNKKLNGYTEISRAHPYYGTLMESILTQSI